MCSHPSYSFLCNKCLGKLLLMCNESLPQMSLPLQWILEFGSCFLNVFYLISFNYSCLTLLELVQTISLPHCCFCTSGSSSANIFVGNRQEGGWLHLHSLLALTLGEQLWFHPVVPCTQPSTESHPHSRAPLVMIVSKLQWKHLNNVAETPVSLF